MGPNLTDAEMASLSSLWLEFRFLLNRCPKRCFDEPYGHRGGITTRRDPGFLAPLNRRLSDLADYFAVERMYAEFQEPLRTMVGARSPIPPGPGCPGLRQCVSHETAGIVDGFLVGGETGGPGIWN